MKKIQLFLILLTYTLTSYSQNSKIDIAGNWREFDNFLTYIQTSEPDVKKDEVKTFKQELNLPAGKYAVEFIYDKYLDNTPGQSL